MKISQLLETHLKFSNKQSLENNLGDGFLLQHNRIFKNIRNCCHSLKFKFTLNHHTAYLALPFTQLETLLAEKQIPFIDNVSVLSQFGKLDWDDLGGGLKRNYIFHESCHAVARSVFEKYSINKQQKIVQILIEESFANACELLAMLDVKEPAHCIFYEQNSYTWLPEVISVLKKCASDIGQEKLFKFILLAYLYSNFLRENINEKQQQQILSLIEVEKMEVQKLKSLRSLAKIAFTLDYEFRTVTTGLHLKLNNINSTLEEYDFMKVITESSLWSLVINELVEKAVR